jgi:hypothetical protein
MTKQNFDLENDLIQITKNIKSQDNSMNFELSVRLNSYIQQILNLNVNNMKDKCFEL